MLYSDGENTNRIHGNARIAVHSLGIRRRMSSVSHNNVRNLDAHRWEIQTGQ